MSIVLPVRDCQSRARCSDRGEATPLDHFNEARLHALPNASPNARQTSCFLAFFIFLKFKWKDAIRGSRAVSDSKAIILFIPCKVYFAQKRLSCKVGSKVFHPSEYFFNNRNDQVAERRLIRNVADRPLHAPLAQHVALRCPAHRNPYLVPDSFSVYVFRTALLAFQRHSVVLMIVPRETFRNVIVSIRPGKDQGLLLCKVKRPFCWFLRFLFYQVK